MVLDGDPAESVLHFVSDVLSSPDPNLATRFLGLLPTEGPASSKILASILSKLTLLRSAEANLSVYAECLHSLAEVCSHSSYKNILNNLISDDPVICRDIFNAVITANEALLTVKEQFPTKTELYLYKTDIYTVLAKCLPFVNNASDLHRITLQHVFRNFFSSEGRFIVLDDLRDYEGLSDDVWKQLNAMYKAMASVIDASVLQHWTLFKQTDQKAFGNLCNLAYKSLKVVSKNAQIPGCKTVSEASCSIARNILNKLCEEIISDGRILDEMLRNLPLVEIGLSIFYNVDTQMSEELRTHIFGMIHAVLCFILGLPSTSTLKPHIQQSIAADMHRVCKILNENLVLDPKSKEIHVLLFELMSLLLEFCHDEISVLDAFMHCILNSMPAIVSQLRNQTAADENHQGLLNAQFVLLSKLATRNGNEMFAKKASDLILESGFFDLLLNRWPPHPSALARVRQLHTTICLALKFLLILLSQRATGTVANRGIVLIFQQHLDQFRIALIQGTRAQVLAHEWIPDESDTQVAKLVETIIFNSQIKSSRTIFNELSRYCPSSNTTQM
eukprot:g2653.t1